VVLSAQRGRHAQTLQLGRRLRGAFLAAAVLGSYGLVGGVSQATAASLTGSAFEIDTDANLTVQAGVDWLAGGTGTAMRAGVHVRADLPSGGADDSFTQGTHENSAVPTTDTGSIPPNKSDLKQFGVYTEQTGSAVFLNVFWTRVQDPSGTTNMDFEFNQSATTNNDPTGSAQIIPVRTVGDLLLTYDLSNGGSVATISKRFWGGSSWGASMALTGAQALGAVNSSAIAATDSGGLGSLSARTFGEASVDLAALLPVDQGCLTYGSAYLKSRSSDSFSAELKDFIAPQAVAISNCGAISIHKTDANGPLAGATFTLHTDVAPIGGTLGATDIPVVPAASCTTDVSGNCTITDVKKGEYWLVESTIPAGHDGVADQHVSITSGDQVVSLTLDDPIQTGTITVVKNAVPNDAQDFTFTVDSSGFSLDDDADATLPNTRSFTVPVGTHTVTETNIPSGWTLSNLVCSGEQGIAGAVATVGVVKNQTVTCTYTDAFTKLAPHLATTAAVAAGGGWTDTATVTGDGVHAVTGTVEFFACAPNNVATACTAGTKVGTTVSIASGSAQTSIPWVPSGAGWSCFRAVFTSTSGFYTNDEHTNTSSECFLKQNADLTVSKTAHAAFGRKYSWTVGKVVDKARLNVPGGSTATSNYTVTVANTFVDSAWTVSGTITVTNPNSVPFTGVNVTDAIDNGAGNCAVTAGTNVTIPAGGHPEFAYVCTYASAPAPNAGTNTATATWNGSALFTPDASATGTAHVDFAGVTPSVTDEIVTVTDSVQGPLGTLDARTASNPTVFTYSVDRSGVAGTCTDYPNTATAITNDSESSTSGSASVKVCVGADLTAGVTADATRDRDHLWSIGKVVDSARRNVSAVNTATFSYQVTVTPGATVDSNHNLTGLVTATNPNDWEAVTATLTVTTDLPATCTVINGAGISVPASGSLTRAYTCVFSATPSGNGHVTATVTWSAAAAATPHGSASVPADAVFATVHETHSTVTVVDDKTDPAHPVTLGTRNVDQGAHTYTYTVTPAGVTGTCTPYTNIASLTETQQSATQTVTVCVGADLTVAKTALATDHRTFLWTLAKNVDRTTASVPAGGKATFAYTVTATPAGSTEDGWSVTGQITVTNPNDWEAITADVSDSLNTGGGGTCALNGNSHVSVPASGSTTLTYTCTFTSKPADGTNTATATWDTERAATPHGTATGTATVVFVPSTQTNQTVTVVDDKTDPAHPVPLGTATFGDAATVFHYTVDVPATAGTCISRTNTAVISETRQSASRSVTVCSGNDLTVVPTAAGSFDRDHLWTISKAVDRTSVTAADGAKVVFTYTVTASPAGFSDSGYALVGTVTATNPNDWEAVVADLAIATDLGGDPTCTVTDGTGRSVPALGSVTVAFACTFATAPATAGTVSATALWNAATAFTPTGTAAASAAAALVLDQSSHDVVTVHDDVAVPGNVVELGTAAWSDGPAAFSYPVTKTAVGGQCSSFTNTAILVETQQQAQQTAELCGEVTGGGGGGVITPPVTTGGGGGLVFTGDMNGLLFRWGLGLLLGGGLLLLSGRRRQA
jgi:hypothetical protein